MKNVEGINYQEDKFQVPMWLTLALLSELAEVLNETKIHKWWDRLPVNREKLKEELLDLLSHIGNLANELDVDLIVTVDEVQTTSLERQFIYLAYKITTLPWKKMFGKHKLDTLIAKYVELVYSLGFDMDQIKEAYFTKMEENYLNPKFS
ncbi:dUTP diphosphatase [Paraclostridium ghonii]|uniref:dUTP diphosphatase n=1 Tax=Paraclostridium ghonii TaxID=29358 RepID=UPI00202CAF44|nr:dUTP diphosphatase [Paeniclostridium ghonii]MCM0167052.1 dUTP diphosphatase [Paeniclostridium ghonii]